MSLLKLLGSDSEEKEDELFYNPDPLCNRLLMMEQLLDRLDNYENSAFTEQAIQRAVSLIFYSLEPEGLDNSHEVFH